MSDLSTSILYDEYGLIGPVLCDDFILGCCLIFRKSVLNKIGYLNEGFGLGYHEEGEMTDRLINNGYKLGYYTKRLTIKQKIYLIN